MAKEPVSKTQREKFKEAAHELETDDSEEAFDRIVKGVARKKPKDDDAKKKPAK